MSTAEIWKERYQRTHDGFQEKHVELMRALSVLEEFEGRVAAAERRSKAAEDQMAEFESRLNTIDFELKSLQRATPPAADNAENMDSRKKRRSAA